MRKQQKRVGTEIDDENARGFNSGLTMKKSILKYCLPNKHGRLIRGIGFNLACMASMICFGALSVEAVHGQEQTQQTQSDQEQTQDTDGWDFRIGFPLWAPWTKGTVGVRNRQVHIDDSLSDLKDSLDFIMPLNVEIRKSRFLFFSDGFYLKTSESGEPRGLFSGAQVQLENKTVFDDLAIGYAVVKTACFSVEPFAGAQLVYLEPKLTLDLPVTDRSASASKFWADPIVGVYLHYRINKLFGLYTKGDVGGFDVSSKLTWQIEGGLDFSISYFYARLAYRYLDNDYQKGQIYYNVNIQGPQLELGVRF